MICWILRKLQDWLTKPEERPSMDEWVCAPTSIPYADKAAFVNQGSYVGGSILIYHPRFKEMQADFLAYKEKIQCPSSEKSR